MSNKGGGDKQNKCGQDSTTMKKLLLKENETRNAHDERKERAFRDLKSNFVYL